MVLISYNFVSPFISDLLPTIIGYTPVSTKFRQIKIMVHCLVRSFGYCNMLTVFENLSLADLGNIS